MKCKTCGGTHQEYGSGFVVPCNYCDINGNTITGTGSGPCKTCKGKLMIETQKGITKPCPDCRTTGKEVREMNKELKQKCDNCNGDGFLIEGEIHQEHHPACNGDCSQFGCPYVTDDRHQVPCPKCTRI